MIGAHRQKDGTLKLGSLDQVTLDVVRQAVDMFVSNPGMTIGDVVKILPFGEDRALKVATTEITRAYAQGQQMAGDKLKEEYPDVRVVKTWYTNNDDRVCDICGPLDGQTVDIDAEFDQDIYYPPAHVNCRCWQSTSTRME